MGIYISGVDMPPAGKCKTITIFDNGTVVRANGSETLGKAIHVPDHGKLFDADALRHWILTEMASLDTKEDREYVADRLANELPTIIPADPVKEGNSDVE